MSSETMHMHNSRVSIYDGVTLTHVQAYKATEGWDVLSKFKQPSNSTTYNKMQCRVLGTDPVALDALMKDLVLAGRQLVPVSCELCPTTGKLIIKDGNSRYQAVAKLYEQAVQVDVKDGMKTWEKLFYVTPTNVTDWDAYQMTCNQHGLAHAKSSKADIKAYAERQAMTLLRTKASLKTGAKNLLKKDAQIYNDQASGKLTDQQAEGKRKKLNAERATLAKKLNVASKKELKTNAPTLTNSEQMGNKALLAAAKNAVATQTTCAPPTVAKPKAIAKQMKSSNAVVAKKSALQIELDINNYATKCGWIKDPTSGAKHRFKDGNGRVVVFHPMTCAKQLSKAPILGKQVVKLVFHAGNFDEIINIPVLTVPAKTQASYTSASELKAFRKKFITEANVVNVEMGKAFKRDKSWYERIVFTPQLTSESECFHVLEHCGSLKPSRVNLKHAPSKKSSRNK